jgi:hypothetical protein
MIQQDLFGNTVITQKNREEAWNIYDEHSNIVDSLLKDFHNGKYKLEGDIFTSYKLALIALNTFVAATNGRTDSVLDQFKPVESILDDYIKWKFWRQE